MNGEKAARERGEASTERENGESASESSSWWENLSDKTRRAAQRAGEICAVISRPRGARNPAQASRDGTKIMTIDNDDGESRVSSTCPLQSPS